MSMKASQYLCPAATIVKLKLPNQDLRRGLVKAFDAQFDPSYILFMNIALKHDHASKTHLNPHSN